MGGGSPEGPGITRESLHALLAAAVRAGASDVHLRVPDPPTIRVQGALQALPGAPLAPADTARVAEVLLAGGRPGVSLDQVQEVDFAYSIAEVGRFRVNVFRQRGSLAAVVRVIPHEPGSLKDLGLPPVVARLALAERGLILVTGAAGSGKSTTIAAMIAHVNRHRRCHVVTIEDPIEYLHRNQTATISQREVGSDTASFSSAFRAVLRQDPDVILVGEMRDAESMDMALKAAETGHLVLSTLHTTDTVRTFHRALSFFPAEAQAEARHRLADALQAVLCQRLLPRADGQGRVLAVEVMVTTGAIRDALKDPKKSGLIRQYLAEGRDHYGTQTFDQHVYELWRAGTITYDAALAAASSPSEFQRDVSLFQAEQALQEGGVEVELYDPDPPRPAPAPPRPPTRGSGS